MPYYALNDHAEMLLSTELLPTGPYPSQDSFLLRFVIEYNLLFSEMHLPCECSSSLQPCQIEKSWKIESNILPKHSADNQS
jgi:hypothetical protein